MSRRFLFLLPLVLIAALGIGFWFGLQRDPQALPSALINKPVPEFSLAAIEGSARGFRRDDLLGKVSLVNIFGSWCLACRIEHPFLMELKVNGVVSVYGINWREPNRQAGPEWLDKFGNPYRLVGDDPRSEGAIAFGVTGAPETFFVDRKGIIRYKHAGPITRDIWERKLWPIVQRLRAES